MQMPLDVAAIGALQRPAFVALLGGVFEGSPWVADQAWDAAPFADLDALHGALVAAVDRAPREQRLALIRAHPELAGRARLTRESAGEQVAAGLDRLSAAQADEMDALNAAYRDRFGFPFVICARDHGADDILAAMRVRVAHDPDTEERIARSEIARIARLRLEDIVAS